VDGLDVPILVIVLLRFCYQGYRHRRDIEVPGTGLISAKRLGVAADLFPEDRRVTSITLTTLFEGLWQTLTRLNTIHGAMMIVVQAGILSNRLIESQKGVASEPLDVLMLGKGTLCLTVQYECLLLNHSMFWIFVMTCFRRYSGSGF
jgi:hypothetical protein